MLDGVDNFAHCKDSIKHILHLMDFMDLTIHEMDFTMAMNILYDDKLYPLNSKLEIDRLDESDVFSLWACRDAEPKSRIRKVTIGSVESRLECINLLRDVEWNLDARKDFEAAIRVWLPHLSVQWDPSEII